MEGLHGISDTVCFTFLFENEKEINVGRSSHPWEKCQYQHVTLLQGHPDGESAKERKDKELKSALVVVLGG